MKFTNRLFILLTLCGGMAVNSYAQKQKVFTVDEEKILLNKNLDFFISRLNSGKFTTLKSKRDIPKFIKSQLPFFSDKAIADTGGKYQAAAVANDTSLPERRLVFLAKSNDVYVITYLKGGTNRIVFVKVKESKVADMWSGNGCINCRSVKNIATYVKENKDRAWALNNSAIDL